MSSTSDITARVQHLVNDTNSRLQSGDLEGASMLLREASALDSSNPNVKALIEKVDSATGGSELVSLIKIWLESKDEHDGEEALEYLHNHEPLSSKASQDAMLVLMEYTGDADCADEMTGILLQSPEAKKVLAKQLVATPTITFNKIFERGDDSMDAQTNMLLEKANWTSDNERVLAERDVFQLCLAQLMKAGQDFPERAMKALSRLLGVEAGNLNGLMDADGFDIILSNLDIRMPSILRGHATLACIKLLELSPDTAKQLMSQYIVQHIEKPTAERLVQAFSAAAAVFPMSPETATQLFLTSGFLPRFVKLVEKYKSQRVEQAALELLNAACMDQNCRKDIRTYCPDWLKSFTFAVGGSPQSERRQSQVTLASLVLEKIRNTRTEGEHTSSAPTTSELLEEAQAQDQRVSRFTILIRNESTDKSSVQSAMEGLAYASMEAKVKEKLGRDEQFLKRVVDLINGKKIEKNERVYVFGGLTVLANVTTYRPALTAEQKKMAELKAYANNMAPVPLDPLDDDKHVAVRCVHVLNAGIVPAINSNFTSLSPTSSLLALQILNSISKDKNNRGKLVQQGALKTLLQFYDRLSKEPNISSASKVASLTAAHAIARILISVNPAHAFSTSSPSISGAIRPLIMLLNPEESDGGTDWFPTFEALMALTNLASQDPEKPSSPAAIILQLGWKDVENLILHSDARIQRAAAELVCNLCASPAGAAHFAADKYGIQRLTVLFALADIDDVPTRSAASGALAMLAEWDPVVPVMLEVDGIADKVWRTVEDEDMGVALRGLTVSRNLAVVGGEAGKKKMRVVGWEQRLLIVLETGGDELVGVGRELVEALR
jgi:protein unc-45